MLPNFVYEKELWEQGYDLVCGIDEVGKGAWAGPLTVGIAIAGDDEPPPGINDSKTLTEKKREEIFDAVAGWCKSWSLGFASSEECDELGMSDAQRLAVKRAFESLDAAPDWALLDGKWNFLQSGNGDAGNGGAGGNGVVGNLGVTNIVKGDQISISIAAASILAKVSRDRMMREIGDAYGPYRFPHNKGYRCTWHLAALKAWGATPIHRQKWSFMDETAFAHLAA